MNTHERKPRIGLLLGDPTGIGPELVAKLLSSVETSDRADILLIGDRRLYRRGFEIANLPEIEADFAEYSTGTVDYPIAQLSPAAGEYVLGSLRLAIEMMRAG